LRGDLLEPGWPDAGDAVHGGDARERAQLQDLLGPVRTDLDDPLQLVGPGAVDVHLPLLTATWGRSR
jgi:hypothetical protein